MSSVSGYTQLSVPLALGGTGAQVKATCRKEERSIWGDSPRPLSRKQHT